MDKKIIEKIIYGVISIILVIVVIWLSFGLFRMGDVKPTINPSDTVMEGEGKLYDN